MAAGDFMLYNANQKMYGWKTAVDLCEEEGASLFTPINQQMEQIALTHLWTSGAGRQS